MYTYVASIFLGLNVNFIWPPRAGDFWRPDILFQVLYHMQNTSATMQKIAMFSLCRYREFNTSEHSHDTRRPYEAS